MVSYDHDPMGRRIVKRVDGAITEKYLWKDAVTLLAVYDGSDNLIMRFDYADERIPVSMERQGMKYYLLYDQVGSLRAVSDASGNIVKRIDYDSFGNIVYEDNLPFSVPFGFAGGLHDKDVKLVRFGARDYDPSIGRWTAKDPIDFGGGDTNLFGYVGQGPVNGIDPLGLQGDSFEPLPWPASQPTPEEFFIYATDRAQEIANIIAERGFEATSESLELLGKRGFFFDLREIDKMNKEFDEKNRKKINPGICH